MSGQPYRTVWVVEEGAYSDYRFHCAFEREADAQATVAAGLGEFYSELTLFEAGRTPQLVAVNWHGYATVVDASTSPPAYWKEEAPRVYESGRVWDFQPKSAREPVAPERPETRVSSPHSGVWRINVSGRNAEGVLKACSDKYAEIRARRDGIAS